MENSVFKNGKLQALLMGLLTVLLCLVLGDGFLGLVSYRDDPTMKTLVVLPGMAVFALGLFLPPWLFRKTVSKKEVFLNIPLYVLAYFLLRRFFAGRVFLTQHYFLRDSMFGFISLPGEALFPLILLLFLFFGCQWISLPGSNADTDPGLQPEKREEAGTANWFFIGFGIVLAAMIFLLVAVMYYNSFQSEIDQQIYDTHALDYAVELSFDENGMATCCFNNHYYLSKRYGNVGIYLLDCQPVGSGEDISVELYEKMETVQIPGWYSETESERRIGDYVPAWYEDLRPSIPEEGILFQFLFERKGQVKDFQLVFRTDNKEIKHATVYLFGDALYGAPTITKDPEGNYKAFVP